MANNIFKELEKGSLSGLKRCISLFPSSVTAKNSAGATPLHVASAQGRAACVKDLLVHGAPHDLTDGQGNLPLHLAAEQGSVETVTELLTGPGRKLVVKAKNREGQTPLHLAVRNGHHAVVAKLLDAGARTDVKDKAGITPLELVSSEDEEMLQLLLDGTPTSSLGSLSQGIGTAMLSARTLEPSQSTHRLGTSVSLTPSAPTSGASGRFATPPPVIVSGRIPAATPSTPPSRSLAHGTSLASARSSHAAPVGGTPGGAANRASAAGGTPGGVTSRLPRNVSMGASSAASVAAAAAAAAGAAAAGSGGAAAGGGSSSVNAQIQRQDAAIQALKADLRTATERLGAVDACAAAQLECASQVEKALEACGSNSRALADLEARVGFQEERGRDARSRLERLEEGERSLQASVTRLSEDNRGLGSQLQRLADQVAANASAPANHQQTSMPNPVQIQLQSELAVLKAQVDQLSPALVVATAASAEARALASRIDSLQQQVQQQAAQQAQHQAQSQQQQLQAAQQPVSSLGSNMLMDQQVLQLQAQVQLLQLPVASLTQQCADLSSRMTGITDWQQQARAELTRLADAAAQAQARATREGANGMSGELSDAVMRVLDTTARTMAELRAQQDETTKQVLALQQQLQQQQQEKQAQSAVPATPQPSAQPGVPVTPQSARYASTGGLHTLSSMARDTAAQAELRSELESLKSLVADVRKEVASEGGSLRREWQRAFSDMQSRYGEQATELRSREQNIAKLREAMLVEEAERRAASEYEEKTAKRLGKLETGLEYLTHRLEVLEEQVSGLTATVAGTSSPPVALSPVGLPPAGHLAFGKQDSRSTPRSGPGPVSENHSCAASPSSHLTAVAAATLASSLMAAAACGGDWSAGGAAPQVGPGPMGGQMSGGARHRSDSQAPSPLRGLGARLRLGGGADAKRAPETLLQNAGVGLAAGAGSGSDGEDWWSAAAAQPLKGSDRQSPVVQACSSSIRFAMPAADASTAGLEAVGCAPDRSMQAPTGVQGTAGVIDAQGPAVTPQFAQTVALAAATSTPQQRHEHQLLAGGCSAGLTPAAGAHAPCVVSSGPQRAGVAPFPLAGTVAGAGTLTPPLSGGMGQSPMRGAVLGGALAQLDPASMVVGPQLLPAAAQALLAPSMDIQRLAAAAAAQQQQQQGDAMYAQRQQEQLQLQAASRMLQQSPITELMQAQGVAGLSRDATGDVAQSPSHQAEAAGRRGVGAASLHSTPRKEPPMCFFCPVQ